MCISTKPNSRLVFGVSGKATLGSAVLVVTNETDNFVAFKIMTSKPKRYSVRPCRGLLQPGESQGVQIFVNNKGLTSTVGSDKFLVIGHTLEGPLNEVDVNALPFDAAQPDYTRIKLGTGFRPEVLPGYKRRAEHNSLRLAPEYMAVFGCILDNSLCYDGSKFVDDSYRVFLSIFSQLPPELKCVVIQHVVDPPITTLPTAAGIILHRRRLNLTLTTDAYSEANSRALSVMCAETCVRLGMDVPTDAFLEIERRVRSVITPRTEQLGRPFRRTFKAVFDQVMGERTCLVIEDVLTAYFWLRIYQLLDIMIAKHGTPEGDGELICETAEGELDEINGPLVEWPCEYKGASNQPPPVFEPPVDSVELPVWRPVHLEEAEPESAVRVSEPATHSHTLTNVCHAVAVMAVLLGLLYGLCSYYGVEIPSVGVGGEL